MKFAKPTLLVIATGAALAFGPLPAALAAEMKAQPGQPFCQRVEDLQPYLMALLQKNMDEAHRYDCGGMPKGARLVILEELGSGSDIGHVAKIRAFLLGGGGSIVGYTLVIKP